MLILNFSKKNLKKVKTETMIW